MWHRLLLFLKLRNEFDWAAPGLGPEVNHPYIQHESLRCCSHCGGGKLHAIHREPFNERRTQEVLEIERRRAGAKLYDLGQIDNGPVELERLRTNPTPKDYQSYIEREH